MSWVMTAVAAVGIVSKVASAQGQAKAAERAGEQQQIQKNFEAAQLAQNATQVRAAAQRTGMEEERRARLIASRALAVGGASGASLSDATMMGILTDIAGEGAYRKSVAIYGGEDRARRMELGEEAAIFEGEVLKAGGEARGDAIKSRAYAETIGDVASMFGMYKKYGGPPKSTTSSLSDGVSWYDAGTPTYSNRA